VTSSADPLAEAALAALGERFSTAVVLFDRSLDVRWASPAASVVLGWSPSDMVGRNAMEMVHPDDLATVASVVEPVLEDPAAMLARPTAARTVELAVRIKGADEAWRPVLVAGRVIDEDGRIVVTARPGEERMALDRVLRLLGRGERLSSTLDAVMEMARAHFQSSVCIVHTYEGAVSVDGAEDALVGGSPEELLRSARSTPGADIRIDDARWVCPVLSHSREQVLAIVVLAVPREGAPTGYDTTVMDRVTSLAGLAFESAMYDRSLHRDATTDHLTGLANRRTFERRLLGLAVDGEYPVTVLFIDLDGFKAINDLHGHTVGDSVLRQVADGLVTSVRGTDFVGRLGGDEFVVACPGLSAEVADELVSVIRSSAGQQLVVEGRVVDVGLSVGVASADDDDALATVLQRADAAMYRNKAIRRLGPGLRLT